MGKERSRSGGSATNQGPLWAAGWALFALCLLIGLGLALPHAPLAGATSSDAPMAMSDAEFAQAFESAAAQQQLAEAAADQAAADAARAEQLESPAAQQNREDSQSAFDDLTGAEARTTLEAEHEEALEMLALDPSRAISDERIESVEGDSTVIVDPGQPGGPSELIDSSLPLVAQTESGEERPVDLAREVTAEGSEPKNPLVPLAMPSELGGGLVLADAITIDLAGADPTSSALPLGGKDVIYPNVEVDTDLIASPVSLGLELFTQLRSPESPEEYRFSYELPVGTQLVSTGDGVLARRGEEVVARIPTPWAVDAQGAGVEVAMTVEGNDLVIDVPHRSADVAYPILVDPITEAYDWYSNNNQQGLGNGEWFKKYFRPGAENKFVLDTQCRPLLATCAVTSNAGEGAYVYAKVDGYQQFDSASWHYQPPGADSYVKAVALTHQWYRSGSDTGSWPFMFSALLTPEGYTSIKTWQNSANLSNQSTQLQHGDNRPTYGRDGAQAVVFGLDSSSSNYNLSGVRWAYLGGASITLDDSSKPVVESADVTAVDPSAVGRYGWTGPTEMRATATATDNGLGVKRLTMTRALDPSGTDIASRRPPNQCTGGHASPCPSSLSVTAAEPFTFSTVGTAQGQRTIDFRAYDALDKESLVVGKQVKIDTKGPQLTLTGGLTTPAPAKAQNPNLHIDATDGTLGSDSTKWASGVKEIRIKVDSEPARVFTNPNTCEQPQGSCPQAYDFTLNRDDYLRDDFVIKVSALDWLNQETSRTLNVSFDPDSTPPTVFGNNVRLSGTAYGPGEWTSSATYRVDQVSATDNKGVKRFRTKVPQASGPDAEQERVHDCTGEAPTPCPKTWSLPSTTPPRPVFESYSTQTMSQGESTVRLEAGDVFGNTGWKEFPVRIDRDGPQITLSGGLSTEAPAHAPSPRLGYSVTDGDGSGPPSGYRSGLRKLTIQVDNGTPEVLYDAPCVPDVPTRGSCKTSGEYLLDLYELPRDNVQLKLVATDEVGHQTTRTLNVILDGGPPRIERILTCEKTGGSCVEGTFDSQGDGDDVPDGNSPRWVSGAVPLQTELESTVFARDPLPLGISDEERRQRGIDSVRLFKPDGTMLTQPIVDCPNDVKPCPDYTGRKFSLAAKDFPEGRQTFVARAKNRSGDVSGARRFQVAIDGRKPVLNVPVFESSPLYQQRASLAYPLDYNLRIQASDGSPADPQSGVERIEVLVDGRRVFLDAKPCETESCALDRTFTFATPEYGSGKHVVEAVIVDGAGNETRRAFEVQNPASVGEPTLPAQKFGLESFFQYDSTETGLSGAHVNLGTGNAVFHRVPMTNPGRGLSSVLNLSYNSYDYPLGGNLPDPTDSRFVSGEYDEAGLGWSLSLSGLTRVNEPLGGVAVSGTEDGSAPPAQITLTDADGTLHTFTLKTSNGELLAYEPPPGVNLRLRAYTDQLKQIKLPEQHTKAWAITRPDGVTYFYDGYGFLRSIEDRNRNVMTFEYENLLLDTGGACGLVVPGICEPRLKRVVDAAGNDPGASPQLRQSRSFTFDYYPVAGSASLGAAGKISKITDHAGRQIVFNYDNNGYLKETVEAPNTNLARRFGFSYDAPNLLQDPTAHPQLRTITDPRGNNTTINYEQKARLPLPGRAVQSVYNRRGNFRSYGYNRPEQGTPSNAYVTDARGKPWSFDFDVRDRMLVQRDPIGRTATLEWDSDNNVITHTEAATSADQATTRFAYNQNGALTSKTDPLGRVTTLTYKNSAGIFRSEHNSFNLDSDADAFVSDLVEIRKPAGNKWTYELEHENATNGAWAPNGNVLSQTDPTGAVARAEYYNKGVAEENRDYGMVRSETNEAGSVTEYSRYDASGMPTEVVDPRGMNADSSDGTRAGHRWLYVYDPAGNLRQRVDPRGASISPGGPPAQSIGESSPFTTTLEYDAHYRVVRKRTPKDTAGGESQFITRRYAYDLNDNLELRTDGEDKVWDTDYSKLDRPTQELTPEGEKTTYEYDAEEALTRITSPRQFDSADPVTSDRAFITNFKLDDVGRRLVTRRQGPSAASDLVTSYAYDRRDNVIGVSHPNDNTVGATAVTDDVAIANAQSPSGQRFAFTFDKADQLFAEVENPSGSCSDRQHPRIERQYRYDLNANLTRELGPRGFCDLANSTGQTKIYDYTARDELAAVTDPAGNRSAFEYTPDGLIKTEISPRAAETSDPNDFATRYDYDANRDLKSKTLPYKAGDYKLSDAELTARKLTYVRDSVGNPIEVTDPVGNLARYRASQGQFKAHNEELAKLHTFKNEFYATGEVKSTTRPSFWRWDGPGSQVYLAESSANVGGGQAEGQLPSSSGQGDLGAVERQAMPGALPMAGKTDFAYDGEMRLTGVTDVETKATGFSYDSVGRLRGIERPFLGAEHITESYRYDAAGNTREVVDGEGEISATSYDAFDRAEIETGPSSGAGPEVTRLFYDPNGNLEKRLTPEGKPWTFEYDDADRMIKEANPLQEAWTHHYDASGNQTLQLSPSGPSGRAMRTAYDAADRATSMTEGAGAEARTTSFTLDASGNRIEIDAPGSAALPASNPADVGAHAGEEARRITTQSFDGRDLPWIETTQSDLAAQFESPDDQASDDRRITLTEYDPNGNLRRVVNPAGVTIDAAGNPSWRPDPGVRFTLAEKGLDGNQGTPDDLPNISNDAVVLDATRNATVYEYSPDDIKRATHLPWGGSVGTDPDSDRYRQDFELDKRGWIQSASHPYKWAAGEQRVATSYLYLENGWISAATDPGIDPPGSGGGSGGTSEEQQRRNLDDRQAITYAYDHRGDQVRWGSAVLEDGEVPVDPVSETRHIERQYWPSGVLKERRGYGTGSAPLRTHKYSYDKNRNMAEIEDSGTGVQTETTQVRYDDADRVRLVDEVGQGAEPDTCYRYTSDGDLGAVHTDGQWTGSAAGAACADNYTGGKATTYAYDSLGQETSMTVDLADTTRDRDVSTSYWPSGDVRTRRKANDTAESFYYDSDGMAALKVRDPGGFEAGGAPETQAYEYDRNANRVEDERGTYAFNSRDHLIRWTRPAGADGYDQNGSVTYVTDGSGATVDETDTNTADGASSTQTHYDYTGQRLEQTTTTQAGSETTHLYDYDDFGNLDLVYKPGQSANPDADYDYDVFNRQILAKTKDKPQETYTYDGLDRRESKKVGSAEVHNYAYVGLTEQLATETEADGDAATSDETRNYDYSSTGLRLGQESKDSTTQAMAFRPYEHDAQGTVLGLEDQTTGAVADSDRYQLDPYGNLENKPPPGAGTESEDALSDEAQDNPFRFQGHYYDSGVQSYDMQARQYLPSVGRFQGEDRYESSGADLALQSDPLTQNRYAFAGGNPISNIEWDGHCFGRGQGKISACRKLRKAIQWERPKRSGGSREPEPSEPSPISPTVEAGLEDLEMRGQLEADLMDSPGFNGMTGEQQAYISNEYVWDPESDPNELRDLYTKGEVLDPEGGAMSTRIAQVEASLAETPFGADLSEDELSAMAVGIAGQSLREQGSRSYDIARQSIARNSRTALLLQELAGSDGPALNRLSDALEAKTPARALERLGRVAYPVDFALNLVGGDGLEEAAGRTGLSAFGGFAFIAAGRLAGGAFGTTLGPAGTVAAGTGGGLAGDRLADEIFGPD